MHIWDSIRSTAENAFAGYVESAEIGYEKLVQHESFSSAIEGFIRLLGGFPVVGFWALRSVYQLFTGSGETEDRVDGIAKRTIAKPDKTGNAPASQGVKNRAIGGINNPSCNCFMNAALQVALEKPQDLQMLQKALTQIQLADYRDNSVLQAAEDDGWLKFEGGAHKSSSFYKNLKKQTIGQVAAETLATLNKLADKKTISNEESKKLRLNLILMSAYFIRIAPEAHTQESRPATITCYPNYIKVGENTSLYTSQEDPHEFLAVFFEGLYALTGVPVFQTNLGVMCQTKAADGSVHQPKFQTILSVEMTGKEVQISDGINSIFKQDFKEGEKTGEGDGTPEELPLHFGNSLAISAKIFETEYDLYGNVVPVKKPINNYIFDNEKALQRKGEFSITFAPKDLPPQSYTLSSFLVHQGTSANGGHYYSYKREEINGKKVWVKYNDSHVDVVREKEVADLFLNRKQGTPSPYLLRFEKQPAPLLLKDTPSTEENKEEVVVSPLQIEDAPRSSSITGKQTKIHPLQLESALTRSSSLEALTDKESPLSSPGEITTSEALAWIENAVCNNLQDAIDLIKNTYPEKEQQEALRKCFALSGLFTEKDLQDQTKLFFMLKALFLSSAEVGLKQSLPSAVLIEDPDLFGWLGKPYKKENSCIDITNYFKVLRTTLDIDHWMTPFQALHAPVRGISKLVADDFIGMQAIKGDGSCYYRATMYYHIGRMIATNDPAKLQELIEKIQGIPEIEHEAQNLLNRLEHYKLQLEQGADYQLLVKEFQADMNTGLDAPLTLFARHLTAKYVEEHRQEFSDALDPELKNRTGADLSLVEDFKAELAEIKKPQGYAGGPVIYFNPLGKALGVDIVPQVPNGNEFTKIPLTEPNSSTDTIYLQWSNRDNRGAEHFDILFPNNDPMWISLTAGALI